MMRGRYRKEGLDRAEMNFQFISAIYGTGKGSV